MFKSDQDQARGDKLAPSPAPAISSSTPSPVPVGTTAVQIKGSGFKDGATVTVNAAQRTANVADPYTLGLTLNTTDVQTAGKLTIVVTNPDGGASSPYDLIVQ